ncbi:type II toxin-antitoxin system VapC family toxin [Mycobacterium sp.]|uniref:type II toxin-antitoxin system VapC family toxin n=1 Tax=Mycobacterium sp. TaxID=1785 RepID=UPI003C722B95
MTTLAAGSTPAAILLDTNALLWLVSEPAKLSPMAREVLSEPRTEIMVSAASAWEIAIKTRLGRIDGDTLLSAWSDIIADMTATELPIDAADAILAGRLPWEHKDPFDRMLVAQAARRNLTIATSDARILGAALTPTLKT